MARQKFTVDQIKEVLIEARGRIYLAADELGCDPRTIYNYIDRFPTLGHLKESLKGKRVDKAEDKLDVAVERGESWAICFLLKTIGKDRGYVERQEHTGKDGKDYVIRVVYGDSASNGSDTTAP